VPEPEEGIIYDVTLGESIKNRSSKKYHFVQYRFVGSSVDYSYAAVVSKNPPSGETCDITIQFQNNKGEICTTLEGKCQSAKNDYVLLFDGKSFRIEKIFSNSNNLNPITTTSPKSQLIETLKGKPTDDECIDIIINTNNFLNEDNDGMEYSGDNNDDKFLSDNENMNMELDHNDDDDGLLDEINRFQQEDELNNEEHNMVTESQLQQEPITTNGHDENNNENEGEIVKMTGNTTSQDPGMELGSSSSSSESSSSDSDSSSESST